eukprot:GHRQ01026351.1.p1 GENE.GHRQ01026351.1~~GHRQ01026351.1.p1  ORF type:complete len:372 (+),score=79.39 GHRQ01026351.1:168-1283(+)
MGVKSRIKSIDFYKKLPTDLTESTLTGSFISIVAATVMGILLVLELASFLQIQSSMQLVVDSSPQNELLKVTFNISFPALSCEFATLDVSDALGKKRMNLTKTIRKTPVDLNLESAGVTYVDSGTKQQPKYDDEDKWWDHLDLTHPISHDDFQTTLAHYPIVVINFYAPWCHWCQRLEPAWEAATKEIHEKYPEATDRRIRFAKIDCTAEADLCRNNFITAFPSIRVFRKAHDDIYLNGQHEHEAYTGDRTKDALVAFADSLAPSAGQPYLKHSNLSEAPKTSGCNLAGASVQSQPHCVRDLGIFCDEVLMQAVLGVLGSGQLWLRQVQRQLDGDDSATHRCACRLIAWLQNPFVPVTLLCTLVRFTHAPA